jgi:phosphatidylglycerol---prolipoprotein diacylglyceryl transferase
MFLLSYIIWDPSPGMFNFNLPILNRPILWYGFFFAFGFFVGYLILTYLLRRYFLFFTQMGKEEVFSWQGPIDMVSLKQRTTKFAEQITFYVILGAIIGSRLGDVLFYQNWADIVRDPMSIIAVWHGGLASHGGAIGILIALWLFARKRKIAFWTAVDFTVIPTAIAAVFIRIGNFFNQEILGIPTTLPWGIIFLHPVDGGSIVPRHPAQLYEAIVYLCTFAILLLYWHRHPPFQKRGKLTGLFLLLVFASRSFIEFIKVEQSVHVSASSYLTMGQWLSIPFILLGCWLVYRTNSVTIHHSPL